MPFFGHTFFSRLFLFLAALRASPLATTMPKTCKSCDPESLFDNTSVMPRPNFKRLRQRLPTKLDQETSSQSLPIVSTLSRTLPIIDLTWSSDEEENRTEIEYWSLISFLLTFQVKTNILPTKPFFFLPMKTCLHLCLILI